MFKIEVNDNVEIKIRVAIDIMAYTKYQFWHIGVSSDKTIPINNNGKQIYSWNCENSKTAKRIMKHFISLGMTADCDITQEGNILYAYFCT